MVREKIKRIGSLLALAVLTTMVSCGCVVGDTQIYFASDSGRGSVFKIGDMECPAEEAKIYLANYKNLYGVVNGTDLWSGGYDTETMEKSLKDAALAQLTRVYALNVYAGEQEIALDETELQQAKEAAEEYFDSLNKSERRFTGASRNKIAQMYERYALARKVYVQLMGNVDEDISEDEARVMDVCMVYVTDAQLAEELDGRIKNGATFERLASTYNEGDSIRKSFGRGTYSPDMEKVVFSLEKNEVSEAIAADGGYYFVQCLNKYNEELSEQNKQVIIRQRKEQALADVVEQLDVKYYSHMNERTWGEITLQGEKEIVTDSFFATMDKHLKK